MDECSVKNPELVARKGDESGTRMTSCFLYDSVGGDDQPDQTRATADPAGGER